MAKFETNGDISIEITPEQFYRSCEYGEQVEMCNIIMDNFDLIYESDVAVPEARSNPRSQSQREFNGNLAALEESWMAVTKKDEKKIRKLAEKYGI